jgi:hypothetical protein
MQSSSGWALLYSLSSTIHCSKSLTLKNQNIDQTKAAIKLAYLISLQFFMIAVLYLKAGHRFFFVLVTDQIALKILKAVFNEQFSSSVCPCSLIPKVQT